jgi:hypothetical protein
MGVSGDAFLQLLAEELAHDFAPITRLKKFTSNPAIIGAHAEAAVRRFVRRAVAPLRVSTGAIIYEGNVGNNNDLQQIDTMIWTLGTAPAVFDCGEFALVPRGSCFGLLEIKRSMYNESGKHMQTVLDQAKDLLPDPAMMASGEPIAPISLGVFCVEAKQNGAIAQSLIEANRAILVLRYDAHKDTYIPNHNGILSLVNTLNHVCLLARQSWQLPQICLPAGGMSKQ